MKKKIILYGAKSTGYIFYEMLIEKKIKPKYLFDPFLKKPYFKNNLIFSYKKNDFIKFLKDSSHFIVCIAREDGKSRYMISKEFEKKLLKPISIISKKSDIHKTVKIGSGFVSLPKSYINRGTTIGDYTILNTGSMVDHECKVGNGVHLMGGCYLAGRVIVEDFVSVGATATILPDIKLGKNSIVGAGSVVTKDVKPNTVVVGNPAKYLRDNKPNYNIDIFK
jgi:sugar O-acyltransferase (sialic acid O-acetyltransferase NeuD family)